VILAAGKATRFNGIKQCADIGGQTLLGHIVNQALASDFVEIILVLGYELKKVKSGLGELIRDDKISVVENRDYYNGLSTSLKAGLRTLDTSIDAAVFILGDQPNVSTKLMNDLIKEYKNSNAQLCLPMLHKTKPPRPGNPVIISKGLFPEIFNITGDIGAREIVKRNISNARLVELDDESSQFQINTEDDLKKYIDEVN
jgi:molybdenum cofactor cytidylyltransferase